MSAPNLLAVTTITSVISNILDWCPFAKGDNLDTILQTVNRKIESKATGLDPLFQPHLQYIDVCGLEEPTLSDCEYIHLFLIDLDTAQIQGEKLEGIRSCMHHMVSINPGEHIHLGQVSRSHGMTSLKDFFSQNNRYPVTPADPEIFEAQSDLEKWLETYCKYHPQFYKEVQKRIAGLENPFCDLNLIDKLANRFRDEGMKNQWSEKKLKEVSFRAVNYEYHFIEIAAQFQQEFGFYPDITTIRPSIEESVEMIMNHEKPQLEQRNLMYVQPVRPMSTWTAKQRSAGFNLGFRQKTKGAIIFDDQNTKNMIDTIKDVADTTQFAAALPVFISGKSGPGDFGL